ncbi:hypothetical protein DCAR_0521269 [Daucus carota subsp. sativus]|uniref:Uncharacterized protein n=1 Tax=Daucus carota subsp. sativus TaxID=79200 RepID=A0A164Z540_DAUCS|nr:hypothetical protein DCAR_0521269 [Daucus carota subsp. sativus]
MGNSQSCTLCSPSKDNVIVMTEDGEAIEFKQGTKVYEVLASHPFHKIIRCCSDRTVLSENSFLHYKSLYFLLPEGLSITDATYRSLVNSAISKQLIVQKGVRPGYESDDAGTNVRASNAMEQENFSKILRGDSEINEEYVSQKFAAWKPGLKPIPELISPSPPQPPPTVNSEQAR